MPRFTKALWLLALLVSCKGSDEAVVLVPPTPPANLATEEEAAQIAAALGEIEELAAGLGRPMSFRSVPVLVVASDDNTFTDRPAACVTFQEQAQFILLKRRVLEVENRLRAARVEATLFKVLLHEIGHCYFHRAHDDARIERKGSWIEIMLDDEAGRGRERRMIYSSLDVSIMAAHRLVLPIPLKRYYVAELLGLERATELPHLRKHARIGYARFRDPPVSDEPPL